MVKRNLATLLIALALLSGMMPASVVAAPSASPIAPSGVDTIVISPQTVSVAAGSTFTVDVKIEGSTPVVGSDVQILFDTQYLEGVSVAGSGALPSYFIDNSDLANGVVWFGGGSLTTPVTPPFTFATITFKAKPRLGVSNLVFNMNETSIEGIGGGSILGGVSGAQVTNTAPADKNIVAVRPSSKTVQAGQTFAVDVTIEGTKPAISADVQLLFDTSRLEAVSVNNSGAFPELIDNSNFANGVIWFGGGILAGSVMPNFTFATIVFRAKQTLGTTGLVFNVDETNVEGANGSVFGAVQDGSVTISSGPDPTKDIVAIRPESKTVATDQTFTLDVKVEGPEAVVATDVQILFDTTYLEAVSVTSSGVLPSYFIDNSDLANGKIWFGTGTLGAAVQPPFKVATLTFKAKQQLGTTDLRFNLAETDVQGIWGTVFGGVVEGQVTVGLPNVSIVPSSTTVVGCAPTTADITLNQMVNVKSADVTITFDATKLYVIDADPLTPGTQIAPLTGFLQPDTINANIACNAVDLSIPACDTPAEVGTIRYAATQSAAPWATGSGAIARISFHPVSDGTSNLTITNSQVLNSSGVSISHTQTSTSLTATAISAPVVSIAKISATTARLSWNAVTLAQAYRIYRKTVPYFTPAEPAFGVTTSLQFDDTSALGSTAAEYYYYVKGACADGFSGSAKSNHVGAFDFDLIPGS